MRNLPSSLLLLCWLSAILLAGTDRPHNIIILIGDGMGISQVSTSLFLTNDSPFKKFTSTGFSVTCSADALITDSAAGATALATGERTNNKFIALDPHGKPLKTLLEYAEDLNMATGVVVSSTITHATPASFVAHIDERSRESEIARQYPLRHWEVMIGGGLKYFTPYLDSTYHEESANLIPVLKENKYQVFISADSLLAAKPKTDFYGLLAVDAMPPASKRNYSLGDLTGAALDRLKDESNGFVLIVEGSQIDWACHNNDQDYVLSEMKDFNSALLTALNFAASDKHTLVLATADHETGGTTITGGTINKSDSSSANPHKLKLSFSTKGHSAALVGVFTSGPGAELFQGIHENYEIGRLLIKLINEK